VETYETAWQSKIAGVEMVFEKKEDAEHFQVQFSEIDLRPAIIARRYSELKIMLDLAKSVSDALPPIGTDKLKAHIEAGDVRTSRVSGTLCAHQARRSEVSAKPSTCRCGKHGTASSTRSGIFAPDGDGNQHADRPSTGRIKYKVT
jgi:hypothetical protein